MEVKDRMTVEEFAECFFMSAFSVRKKCRDGEIPAVKPGRRWVVLVDEYLSAQEEKGGRDVLAQ